MGQDNTVGQVHHDTQQSSHDGGAELSRQRFAGWLAVLPLGYLIILVMRVVYRYRIENLRGVRKRFAAITRRGRPLLICPNHLTMIDSIIVLWALASIPRYFVNYRLFSWNIPAVENFKTKLSWRVITYLSKCIPIARQGSADHIESVLQAVQGLLRRGDLCTIFAEGTRSRTGRVDPEKVTYGVGKIVQQVPGCEVLCIYLRGRGQETYSFFPKKGERFTLRLRRFAPVTKNQGLRGARDISQQIISRLKTMEDRHFGVSHRDASRLDHGVALDR